MDEQYETVVRVANRLCLTAIAIAFVFAWRGCYEEKRKFDIIDRMQMPADQQPRSSGKLPRVPDLTD